LLTQRLNRGFAFIVDYGFPRNELLAPSRKDGTYCCYKAHRRDTRPSRTGEKDISAHGTSLRSPSPRLTPDFKSKVLPISIIT
jgi:SAM-dependent MidA family methyltransferase